MFLATSVGGRRTLTVFILLQLERDKTRFGVFRACLARLLISFAYVLHVTKLSSAYGALLVAHKGLFVF